MTNPIYFTKPGEVPKIVIQKRNDTITKVVLVAFAVLLIVAAVVGHFAGLNSVAVYLLAGFGGLYLLSFALNAVKWHKEQKEKDKELKGAVESFIRSFDFDQRNTVTWRPYQLLSSVTEALNKGANPEILRNKRTEHSNPEDETQEKWYQMLTNLYIQYRPRD